MKAITEIRKREHMSSGLLMNDFEPSQNQSDK